MAGISTDLHYPVGYGMGDGRPIKQPVYVPGGIGQMFIGIKMDILNA